MDKLRNRLSFLHPLARLFVKMGIHPNTVTVMSFLLTSFSAYLFAKGYFIIGAVILLIASAFDAIDGDVARFSQKVTKFGAFLDSVLDRYSETFIYMGFAYYYFTQTEFIFIFIAFLLILGAYMLSYTRARAEGLGIQCKVGLLPRGARLVFVAIGAIFGPYVFKYFFLILLILTHTTALQRIAHVYRNLR